MNPAPGQVWQSVDGATTARILEAPNRHGFVVAYVVGPSFPNGQKLAMHVTKTLRYNFRPQEVPA